MLPHHRDALRLPPAGLITHRARRDPVAPAGIGHIQRLTDRLYEHRDLGVVARPTDLGEPPLHLLTVRLGGPIRPVDELPHGADSLNLGLLRGARARNVGYPAKTFVQKADVVRESAARLELLDLPLEVHQAGH